jgi:hypothetical protein
MMIRPKIKKLSKWTFNTSATGGVGVGYLAGSGGLIQLLAPDKKRLVNFHYAGGGGGISRGGSLPKIGKLPPLNLKGKSASGSTTDFHSFGDIYIMEGFNKEELDETDFRGPCIFVDAGASIVIAGWSGTVLFVGIPPTTLLLLLAAGPAPAALTFNLALASAKAVIMVHGQNAGLQLPSIGVSLNMGYLK